MDSTEIVQTNSLAPREMEFEHLGRGDESSGEYFKIVMLNFEHRVDINIYFHKIFPSRILVYAFCFKNIFIDREMK